MKGSIWEGVYKNFSEVPSYGSGFRGDTWIKNSLKKIKEIQKDTNQHTAVPNTPCYQESLLPILTAIIKSKRNRAKILDFGGGLGVSYLKVSKSLTDCTGINFHVIEVEEICNAGLSLFKDDNKINFDSILPPKNKRFDIIHMGSSLHYIEKWQAMLNRLCCYKPKYFLITDLPAGDIPTFATAQKYYDSKIPVWFFDISDVILSMRKDHYKCIFKSTFKTTLYGKVQELPLHNFDENHRIRNSCTMLFDKEILE